MSERKVNNLATTSAQNYAAMEITSKSDKWMIDFGIECAKNEALRNEIAALTAERDERAEQVKRYDKAIAALTAENARLKAPVSDVRRETLELAAEWLRHNKMEHAAFKVLLIRPGTITEADKAWADKLIAARASTPPDANTSWFCVPCGFTTRDAAEAQAHLGPHMIELTCPFDEQIWRFHTQAQADMLQKHLDWHAAQLSTPTPEAR